MICLLAASDADAHEFLAAHPAFELESYFIITPNNYKELASLECTRLVITDRFRLVPNQNEIWLQAKSRCKRSVAFSRRRVANSSKG